jgi:hypothetical protein
VFDPQKRHSLLLARHVSCSLRSGVDCRNLQSGLPGFSIRQSFDLCSFFSTTTVPSTSKACPLLRFAGFSGKQRDEGCSSLTPSVDVASVTNSLS